MGTVKCKVSLWRKLNATLWLFPAWFAPHFKLRAMFHKWRGVRIQGRVFIGYYCTLDNVHPELITLEDGCFVGANSVILTHDNYAVRALEEGVSEARPVHLKKNAGIGIGCLVQPGVTIGENSTVAAHSVVSRDIPDNVMCVLPRKEFWADKSAAKSGRSVVSREDFLADFREQFDDPDAVELRFDTVFHDLDDWSSLVAFSVLSMINGKYGAALSGERMRACKTVEELYQAAFEER